MKETLYFLSLFPMFVIGQTTSQNFVKTTFYKQPTTTPIATPNLQQAIQQVTYFDGLGRPNQQIAYGQSATGKDLVTPIEYDAFGRKVKNYLPYASTQNSMAVMDNATVINNLTSQYSTLYADGFAYSEKELEASPLDRILKQGAPGSDWQLGNNHKIQLEYQTNSANEVKRYLATTTWNAANLMYDINLVDNGFYNANELYKTITKDENWSPLTPKGGTVEEFKNKEGKVILKRTYANYGNNGTPYANSTQTPHNTYYIYDIYGNQTYVLPPLVTNPATELDGLCYQYKHDHRNRLVAKKLPGKSWEYIVYDKLDRVVATGPVFSPFIDQANTVFGWLITKYDAFNRPVYTGWQQETSTFNDVLRATRQSATNSWTVLNESKTTANTSIDGVTVNYTNAIAPNSFKLLTVNYYDDYNYPNAPTVFTAANVFYNNTNNKPKGLTTGSWVRVLEASTANNYEKSAVLYDYKARPTSHYKQNYLGGFTQTVTQLDFVGKTLFTQTTHQYNTNTTTALPVIREDFSYTNQDRLLLRTHQIGTATTELLAENTYNELGQLISKKVGNTSAAPLQKIDYQYNIRGWLTAINDINNLNNGIDPQDLFAFKINYNTVANATNYTGKPLYNGNIAETYWRTANDNLLRKYGYFYDDLNRLNNAVYQKPNTNTVVTNSYNEALQYDKNGNITTLQRNGEYEDPLQTMQIDNLTYAYNANQLTQVDDSSNSPAGFKNVAGNDYAYDVFGNLTKDNNKTITSIVYNHLNLPTKITFLGSNKNIVYIYNATGQKLKKVITNNTSINTTDYLDGFQYLKTGSAGVVKLQFFPTAEGYVSNTVVSGANVYKYVYNYTDHLGNNRLSYSKNNTTTAILEENNYYPFGLKHNNYNLNKAYFDACAAEADLCFNAVNNVPWAYRFNNKEFQGELGLNWYDFEGRNYMPDIVRTPTQDPLSWKFSSQSPYSFLNNNPIKFIDPTGMSAQSNDWHRDDSGTLVADKGDTAETLATYLSISIEDARAEFNHSHYHYEGVMSGGERLYNSDKAVSSGEYGPDKNPYHAAMVAGAVALPVAAAEGLVVAGGLYLWEQGALALSQMTWGSAAYGIGANTVSQGIANGGDLSKVNVIEAGASAIPGMGSTIVGETFNLPVSSIMQGNFMPSTPQSFEQGILQIGGGLLSNKFGNTIDANPLFGKGVGKVYKEVAKFSVETGSNVLPSLGN